MIAYLKIIPSTIPLIQRIEYSEADKVCRIKWSANDDQVCDHISNSTIADLVQSESLNLQGIDSNSAWNECSCKMSSEYKMFTWLMFTFGFLIPTIAFIISYIRFVGLALTSGSTSGSANGDFRLTLFLSVLMIIYKSNKQMNTHKFNLNTKPKGGKSHRKTMSLIISLIVVFIICYSPFQLFHMMRATDIFLPTKQCNIFRDLSETWVFDNSNLPQRKNGRFLGWHGCYQH